MSDAMIGRWKYQAIPMRAEVFIGKELHQKPIYVYLPGVAHRLRTRRNPTTFKRLGLSSQLVQYPHHAMTVADRQQEPIYTILDQLWKRAAVESHWHRTARHRLEHR